MEADLLADVTTDQIGAPFIPARRASFDVALALVERAKGAGICLAQAEGLGNLWRYVLRAEGPTV